MDTLKHYKKIMEDAEKFKQVSVDFNFDPVLSKETFDLHFNKLYSGYVKKAVAGDHSDFNLGGVELHAAYFGQMQPPKSRNEPSGESAVFIIETFGDFETFKEEFTEVAIGQQGSTWVYLSKSGDIKIIKNHKPVSDIALILDMWEHAYVLDYGSNKKKYVDNFWKIIDWRIVNARLS